MEKADLEVLPVVTRPVGMLQGNQNLKDSIKAIKPDFWNIKSVKGKNTGYMSKPHKKEDYPTKPVFFYFSRCKFPNREVNCRTLYIVFILSVDINKFVPMFHYMYIVFILSFECNEFVPMSHYIYTVFILSIECNEFVPMSLYCIYSVLLNAANLYPCLITCILYLFCQLIYSADLPLSK